MLPASGPPLALSLPLRSEREPEYGGIYILQGLSERSGLASLFSSLFVQSRPHIQRLWKYLLVAFLQTWVSQTSASRQESVRFSLARLPNREASCHSVILSPPSLPHPNLKGCRNPLGSGLGPGLIPEQDPEVRTVLPLDQALPDASSSSPPNPPGLCAVEPVQAAE